MASEREARAEIDRLLAAEGWQVQNAKAANLHAGLGVAIREFP
jgi:type I restriction enzyme R subunit